jgi:hypothetical protein
LLLFKTAFTSVAAFTFEKRSFYRSFNIGIMATKIVCMHVFALERNKEHLKG